MTRKTGERTEQWVDEESDHDGVPRWRHGVPGILLRRVKPGGTMSITMCNGTQNTHKLDRGYLRELKPQRNVSRWHWRSIWGKFQILGLQWMD
jgi:hypothetical protein